MCTCKNAVKGRQTCVLQTLLFVLIKLFYTPDFVLLEKLFVMLLSFIPLFFRSCVFVYVTVDWVNLREYRECSPHSLMWGNPLLLFSPTSSRIQNFSPRDTGFSTNEGSVTQLLLDNRES